MWRGGHSLRRTGQGVPARHTGTEAGSEALGSVTRLTHPPAHGTGWWVCVKRLCRAGIETAQGRESKIRTTFLVAICRARR